jgi:hypothetical protein
MRSRHYELMTHFKGIAAGARCCGVAAFTLPAWSNIPSAKRADRNFPLYLHGDAEAWAAERWRRRNMEIAR